MKTWLIAFGFWLIAAPLWAAIYFASPTGSGSGSCPIGTPCTLARALLLATTTGDFIELRAGTYTGPGGSTPLISLGSTQNLTIEAYNSEAVFLTNTYHVIAGYFTNGPGLTLRGLDISCGNNNGAEPIIASGTVNQQNWLIEKNTIHNCDDGILGNFTNLTFRKNYVHDLGASSGCQPHFCHGMYVYMTTSLVYSNIFENMLGGSCSQLAGGDGNKWYNNTCYNAPQGPGIFVYTHVGPPNVDTTNLQIYNNIIANTNDVAINFFCGSCSGITVTYNLLYQNTGGDFADSCGGGCYTQSNNFLNAANKNPLFVSTAAHNFALQATSPAINAGTNTNCAPQDFTGISRPQGSNCDMGAYEFTSGVSLPTVVINTPAVGAVVNATPTTVSGTSSLP